MNIKKHKVEILLSESGYQTFNYLTTWRDSILSTNGLVKSDGSGITYIETIDPTLMKLHSMIECHAYPVEKKGKAITNIATCEEKIIAVVETFENDSIVPYLYRYDQSGEFIASIDMQKSSSNIYNTAITKIAAIGEYIYIRNMSNYVFAG